MNYGVHVFMMLAMMEAEIKVVINELPVVCDFLAVFRDDIRDLPLERVVDFVINLVPSTNPILMALYRISDSELSKQKKLEEKLDKKFV